MVDANSGCFQTGPVLHFAEIEALWKEAVGSGKYMKRWHNLPEKSQDVFELSSK